MRRSLFLIIIACALSAVGQQQPSGKNSAVQTFQQITSELDNLPAGTVSSAMVENKSFRRDAASFMLSRGTIYVLPKILGNVHALVYVGTGIFSLVPPTDVERKQIYRFYEQESFEREIRTLFLLFTDSTYAEFSRTHSFVPATLPSGTISSVKKSLRCIKNREENEYDPEILQPFLYNDSEEMFYCHLNDADNDSYFFLIDPYDTEEVSFGTVNDAISKNFREVISQFHWKRDYETKIILPNEIKPHIDISRYIMKCRIADNMEFSSECSIAFKAEFKDRRWIPLYLYNELSVDSIRWQNGTAAEFVRNEESSFIWLYVPAHFLKEDTLTVVLYYRGDIIHRDDGWYYSETSIGWYPHSFKERDKAIFDLTFSTPKKLTFASVGEKISSETKGDENVTRWVLSKEHRNASFILGSYSEYAVANENLPPLTVYMSEAHDTGLRHYLASQGVLSGKDMEKQVAADIENSIRFFQHVYGNAVSNRFYTAEIPYLHGEAFPGLIHLAWTTFQRTSSYGDDEAFRAHEVAHQWWAVSVDFKTYHDQWLSEGFSTYSGLWYMQIVRKNNELFFDQLKKYKEQIISNRSYLFSKGQEAGPIWLGRRTNTSETAGDYSLIIYKKGAWVLHMLRNMLIDLKTMNEDVFKNMMREFFATHSGKEASTEDFKTVVEKYCGIPMDWFFKQWVYGTEVPTYTITYKLQELPEGKYKVKCTVKQANVPDDFQMYVPFFIDFGDNRFARLRYLIKGPVTEFEFPILPLKPEEIKFNDLESVLCEIDDEDWE